MDKITKHFLTFLFFIPLLWKEFAWRLFTKISGFFMTTAFKKHINHSLSFAETNDDIFIGKAQHQFFVLPYFLIGKSLRLNFICKKTIRNHQTNS